MSSEQSVDVAQMMGKQSFEEALRLAGVELKRGEANYLQINVGYLCNQECKHCHLYAGPDREEIMSPTTARQVVEYARRCEFTTIDITGGAPEMNPQIEYLVENLSLHTKSLIVRSNLTALTGPRGDELIELYKSVKAQIVSSMPAINRSQTDSQRGNGVFDKCIKVLRTLNEAGYGVEGSGFVLNLVSNPAGAYLPPSSQENSEAKFKADLKRKFGISFNNLLMFANVPAGRFRDWLEKSGNLDNYISTLADSFNPCAVDGLMCRTLVSVNWDGLMYDCDFNLSLGLHIGGEKQHVSEMTSAPENGAPIAVSDHCFACAAGPGFT